jgi:ABC-type transport system involved in multi-copper enzyme maturation permease subunit
MNGAVSEAVFDPFSALLDAIAIAALIVAAVGLLAVEGKKARIGSLAYAVAAIGDFILSTATRAGGFASMQIDELWGAFFPVIVVLYIWALFADLWKPAVIAVPKVESDDGAKAPVMALVAGHETRRRLRSAGGLLFLCVSIVMGLTVSRCSQLPRDIARGLSEAQGIGLDEVYAGDLIASQSLAFILPSEIRFESPSSGSGPFAGIGQATLDWAQELSSEWPPLLAFSFIALCLVLPTLLSIAGFGSLSEETKSKSARFALTRVSRSRFLAGHYLSSVAMAVMAVFVICASLCLYLALSSPLDRLPEILGRSLYGFVALSLSASAACAVGLFFSTLTEWSGLAVLMSLGAFLGIALVVSLLRASMPFADLFSMILPMRSTAFMFHHDPWVAAFSALGTLAYAGAYLAAAAFVYGRKDL